MARLGLTILFLRMFLGCAEHVRVHSRVPFAPLKAPRAHVLIHLDGIDVDHPPTIEFFVFHEPPHNAPFENQPYLIRISGFIPSNGSFAFDLPPGRYYTSFRLRDVRNIPFLKTDVASLSVSEGFSQMTGNHLLLSNRTKEIAN